MTLCQEVFDTFLKRIDDDFWLSITDDPVLQMSADEIIEDDLISILKMAIFDFRYSEIALTIEQDDQTDIWQFVETLTDEEIQVLANYMVVHWIDRYVLTARNLRKQYTHTGVNEPSIANLIRALASLRSQYAKVANDAYYTYRRRHTDFANFV